MDSSDPAASGCGVTAASRWFTARGANAFEEPWPRDGRGPKEGNGRTDKTMSDQTVPAQVQGQLQPEPTPNLAEHQVAAGELAVQPMCRTREGC
jgi:hypothetical protein